MCPPSSAPRLAQIRAEVGGSQQVDLTRNRVLGIRAGDWGRNQKIRVTFVSSPPPWDAWNGTKLWVADLFAICDLPGVEDPGDPACTSTFTAASLSCDPALALAMDWTTVGEFHIVHPGIIPSSGTVQAIYEVAVMEEPCDPNDPESFATIEVVNSVFGDISGQFDPDAGLWVVPDTSVNIFPDVLAAIDAFGSRPGNVTKLRADILPCVLDFKINIIDIVQLLDAFRGLAYSFAPGLGGCPADPCDG